MMLKVLKSTEGFATRLQHCVGPSANVELVIARSAGESAQTLPICHQRFVWLNAATKHAAAILQTELRCAVLSTILVHKQASHLCHELLQP